jgi:hypothetical protein
MRHVRLVLAVSVLAALGVVAGVLIARSFVSSPRKPAAAGTTRPAPTPWQTPSVVPASGHGRHQQLRLAMGASNGATLVWSDEPSDRGAKVRAVFASVRLPSGRWSRPSVLARARWLSEPAVAGDAQGRFLAAWAARSGREVRVFVSERAPTGRFGTPRIVDRGAVGHVPGASMLASIHLAVAPGGAAVLTWVALTPQRTFVLRALVRDAAGTWSHPVTLGFATPDIAGPQSAVAIDGKGRPTVSWIDGSPGPGDPRALIARGTAGGAFAPARTLLRHTVGGLALLTRGDGSIAATAAQPSGQLVEITQSASGGFSRPRVIARTGIGVFLVQLVGDGTRELASWLAAATLDEPLHAGAAILPAGSATWARAIDLGIAAPVEMGAVFAGKTPLVAWVDESGQTHVAQAASGTSDLVDDGDGALALGSGVKGTATLAQANPAGIVTRVRS